MESLLSLAMAVQPTPSESDLPYDPAQVTPGTLGFIVTLLVAIAIIFLIRDMSRRLRRMRLREEYGDQSDHAVRDNDADDDDADGSPQGGRKRAAGRHGPDAYVPNADGVRADGVDGSRSGSAARAKGSNSR